MNHGKSIPIEAETHPGALTLADTLDPAIGEASSVMGAMLTELVRRSLRGGVLRIGGELQHFVAEKVDIAVAEKVPQIEQIACDVAENTARTAATEVATEEVQALEKRTKAGDELLAARIDETARTALESSAAQARALAAQLQEAERRVGDQIQQTGRSAVETARGELNQELQKLTDKLKERSERLKARFAALEATAAELGRRHTETRDDLARRLDESRSLFEQRLDELVKANDVLRLRVEELEKPRGMRAVWNKVAFWRKSPAGPDEPPGAGDAPTE